MGLVYKICPRCFRGRPFNELCQTPECAQLRSSPSYFRDELVGQLHIARAMLAEGNTDTDYADAVKELERELVRHDSHHGAAAFKQ